ncbi:MAG: hypothetical protein IPK75_20655 [Acidobacteria bacterium]|nr:hypothetical protein [Acidobacteriota bacterium]
MTNDPELTIITAFAALDIRAQARTLDYLAKRFQQTVDVIKAIERQNAELRQREDEAEEELPCSADNKEG